MADLRFQSPRPKSGLLYVVVAALLLTSVYLMWNPQKKTTAPVGLSTFIEQVNKGEITKIQIRGNKLIGQRADGINVEAIKESGDTLRELLSGTPPEVLAKLQQEVVDTESESFWTNLFLSILPFLLIVGFFVFMMRHAQSTNNQAMSFGKSMAKLYEKGKQHTTFADVAGAEDSKDELKEIVDFLKTPAKYTAMGAKIPKGVLLMGPPGTGKCVTGETLVLTNKGLLPIRDIPKYFHVDTQNRVHGAHVVAFGEKDRKNHITQASHWYNLGEAPTIKITTQLGHTLEGTPEHPIIVLEKNGQFAWKRLEEIRENEYVVIKYNTQCFGKETRIPDEDTAYVIGLLIGDGGLTVKGRISFTTAQEEILNFFKKYCKERFKYAPKKTSGKYDWCIHQEWIIKKFMEEYGLTAVYAKQKTVPEWIRMAPKPIVQAFLRGLFDTDGSMEKRGAVQLSSASETLIHEATLLLLNLGVVNRIFHRRKLYNGQHQYYLEISGDFLPAFQREIGFRYATEKTRRLTNYLEQKERNTNTNLIFFQKEFIRDIWNSLKQQGIEVYATFQKQRGLQYKNILRYLTGERQPSLAALREFMQKVAELAPPIVHRPAYQHIASIVFSGFFFTPVTKVQVAQETVYDFTVPKYHSFVGNGMISHNTLLARAVAGEANVPFFSMVGSEFVEMFVGVGASRVRDLFRKAKRNAPCIIFIDEIDAVGRHRGAGLGGGHDEREQTLNQILAEMDGFEKETQVIIMAATNRPDVLDPALLRPGRFDRRVVVDMPDLKAREEILIVHSRGKPLAKNITLSKIARQTVGFSGADLENLMNEAALMTARDNKKQVGQSELEQAIEKVALGPEKKSRVLSPKEKEITACHEIGHALVAQMLEHCDPVHKVSIISRGMALGVTWYIPEEDLRLHSKAKFKDELCSMMGGYMAEKLLYGPESVTTGSSNDLEKATTVARKMVMEYGMSDLGPVIFGDQQHEVFLGRDFGHVRNYSEDIAARIDGEIQKFMKEAEIRTEKIIRDNIPLLKKIADKLMQKETLTGDEFRRFFPEEFRKKRPTKSRRKSVAKKKEETV